MADDEQQAGPAQVMDATPNPEDDDAPPPPSRKKPPPRAASSASSAQKKLAKSASTMALHAARLPRGRTPPPDTDSVRAVAASTASLSHLRQLNRRYVTAPSSGFFPPLPEKNYAICKVRLVHGVRHRMKWRLGRARRPPVVELRLQGRRCPPTCA